MVIRRKKGKKSKDKEGEKWVRIRRGKEEEKSGRGKE
jgi:hypothetical protein